MRCLATLVVASACGRIYFDARLDAAGPDVGDAPGGPSLCGFSPGAWQLSPPEPLDSVNAMLEARYPAFGDRGEFDPVFSEDGLSLHFSSDQSNRFIVWTATRPAVAAPFDTLIEEPGDINAAANGHFGFQPLASLATAMISAPYAGTIGGRDYWLGTFAAGMWAWTSSALSTADDDDDARMTGSGLVVYVVRGQGEQRDIYRAKRDAVSLDFAPAEPVPELASASSDAAPFPVDDDSGILVVTTRAGGLGNSDLWYASRSAAAEPFDSPVPLTELNSPAFDGEPALFDHGGSCELVFVSNRDGTFDLYRSRVTAR